MLVTLVVLGRMAMRPKVSVAQEQPAGGCSGCGGCGQQQPAAPPTQ